MPRGGGGHWSDGSSLHFVTWGGLLPALQHWLLFLLKILPQEMYSTDFVTMNNGQAYLAEGGAMVASQKVYTEDH